MSKAGRGKVTPPPKKALQRARDVAREARGMLKAKSSKVGEARAAEVKKAFDGVVALLPAKGQSVKDIKAAPLHAATNALDRSLDDVFGHWRKTIAREYLESIVWAIGLAVIIRAFIFEAFSIPSSSMMPTLQIGDHLFVNKVGYGLYVPFQPERWVHWSQPTRGDIIVFEYRFPGGRHDGEDFIKRVIGVAGDRIRLENNTIILNDEAIPTEILDPATTEGFDGKCGVFKKDDSSEPVSHCPCTRQQERLGAGDDRSEWDTTFITQHFHEAPDCSEPARPDWDMANVNRFARDYFMPAACHLKTTDLLGSLGRRLRETCASLYVSGGELVVPEGHVFAMGDNRDQSDDGRGWGLVPHNRIKGSAFFIWYARDFSRAFTLL